MVAMWTFGMPTDESLLAAIGKVAVRHGQMDYVLRMTIKSLAGLSIAQALDATSKNGSAQLRGRVEKLARQRLGEGPALLKLQAFLTRSRRATERRNELLHSLYAADAEGREFRRGEDHSSNPLPIAADVQSLAGDFGTIAAELNDARLNGFLKEAMDAKPLKP
jgi:hypothetical protein